MNILRSERPSLRGLLALPFSNLLFLIILDYRNIRLITIIIKFWTILLMAWLKNAIIAIILRTARLWTKVMPRTATTEVTITAIRIITTLGMVTAAIAIAAMATAAIAIAIVVMVIAAIVIRVTRPMGVQGSEDCQRLLVVN